MWKTNTPVYFRMPKCACVGGGFTEQFGTIVDIMIQPNKTVWYRVSTEHSGTYVVAEMNIIKEIV